jgi:hypothetical protein
MVEITLPRFVIAKRLKGKIAYYWNPPGYWRKQAEVQKRRFPFAPCPLGTDFTQAELDAAAAPHNLQFDEWRTGAAGTRPIRRYAAHGTVEWLFETYLASDVFKRRVADRSRADYRLLFDQISAIATKDGRTFGKLSIASVTPAAAEKVYSKMIDQQVDEEATARARETDPKAEPVLIGKYRTGEKVVMYAKTVWRLMQPHHPREFRRDVPNPWVGVQLVGRTKLTKPAVNREQVYVFANKAIELGQVHLGAAAVICFEWLQRPENVIGGYIRWGDYRGREYPTKIRIEHHKTGEMILHPLEVIEVDGSVTQFYSDAEQVLATVPRHGLSIVATPAGQLYEATRFAQLVRKVADAAELPKTFTLDACRHGGMTELEEAELTDGQGRALSAHRSRAYEGYAKRTEKRMLAATRRRAAHLQG